MVYKAPMTHHIAHWVQRTIYQINKMRHLYVIWVSANFAGLPFSAFQCIQEFKTDLM